MDVTLKPMTREMYHRYFKEYENSPDLYLDKSRFTPYVYRKEAVDGYVQRQIDLHRKPIAIMLGDEIVGEIIIKRVRNSRFAALMQDKINIKQLRQ